MSVDEFYDMEPREFHNAVKGWEEERRDRLDFDRAMTVHLMSIHLKKGSNLKPTDLYRFPWDNQTQSSGNAKILSKEDAKEIKERLQKTLKLRK